MAMSATLYNKFKAAVGDGATTDYDLAAGTIKACLVTSTYTPDYDAHAAYSDLTNEVANGNGYTTGGVTLASLSWTKVGTGASAKYVFTSTAPTWTATGAGFAARRMIIYKSTGTGSTSLLIASILLDTTPADIAFSVANSPTTINPDATNGWLYAG